MKLYLSILSSINSKKYKHCVLFMMNHELVFKKEF